MLCLRVKAPFATFRTFTAGSFRPTAPFITPSAAYGLVLNVAGLESRFDDGRSSMTLTKAGLPRIEIALGAVRLPEVQSIYQQLHNYPIGNTGKEWADKCKGSKYNIQPIRREFLSNIDAYICVRGNDVLEEKIRQALRKGILAMPESRPRYGIPFLGDNNFMVDILREERETEPTFWYEQVNRGNAGPIAGLCRLTIWIDRADMTKTTTRLYAPSKKATSTIPDKAWTIVHPPGKDTQKKTGRKKQR